MKIHMTFELSDVQRRAIAHVVGVERLASHALCRTALKSWVSKELDIVSHEYLVHKVGRAVDAMRHDEKGEAS